MSIRSVFLIVTYVLVVSALGSTASGKDGAEAPVATASQNPELEWGPCPAFMPKGCGIAVLRGDPAADKADVFLKVPANSQIVSHGHTSAERMVLVSGVLQVTYEGHPPIMLRPGMYAYGTPKLAHKASCANGEPCVLFIAFNSAIDAYEVPGK